VLNLLYFMHLDKAPLILGNCFLPFLYGRNILFLRAGGERGKGRLVFAAVAVLTLLGFGISAFTGSQTPGQSPDSKLPAKFRIAETAMRQYFTEYHSLPTGDSRQVIAALTGKNPKGIHFFEPAGELSSEGDWLDPWGHPYRIFTSEKMFLIRCAGPNGTFDDGNDEKRDDILLESTVE
jgi:hypothetical protein